MEGGFNSPCSQCCFTWQCHSLAASVGSCLESQQDEMEPHKPAQITRFPQPPNPLVLGSAFSLVLNISPRVCGACSEQEGESTTINMAMEEIPLLLQRILDASSKERRAE